MIVSHKHKFIVLLAWKTASQTLLARLHDYNESEYGSFFEFNSILNRVVSPHITCADLKSLPESQLKYFSASFVRNPYDRVYSGFHQLRRDVKLQRKGKFSSPMVQRLIMSQLQEIETQMAKSDGDFDQWVSLLDELQIIEQGHNTSFVLHPSHYWTHFNKTQMVDFIGKVETFETDFGKFCNFCGLRNVLNINENVTELNPATSHAANGYRYIDRMSKKTIDKINYLFKKDFELFDYLMID